MLICFNSPENPQPPPDPNESVEALGYTNLFFPSAILAGGIAVGITLVILEQVSMGENKEIDREMLLTEV